MDILEAYRDLGFVIPDDDLSPSDELEEILEDLQDLGFEIPTDDGIDIQPEPKPEIPDLDFD